MTQPGYPPTSGAGERWSVNMPAVIGVVFVFIVAVIVWVVATSDDDGTEPGAGAGASTTVAATTPPAAATSGTVSGTTTPAPMPDPSSVSTTSSTTDATTTLASTTSTPSTTSTTPATTAAGADPDAVPGDLAIPGSPMQQPGCDGAYITVLASAIGDQATADSMAAILAEYPGSGYLRTDRTCPSLTPASGGDPIYIVFFGPFAFETDACIARADGPPDAYVRVLSDDLDPTHSITCP